MQNLREFNDRPRNHVLQPVYHTGVDLKNYLAAVRVIFITLTRTSLDAKFVRTKERQGEKHCDPFYGGLNFLPFRRCSVNFLLLPGLLEWCAKVHHAFAIGPIHMFDAITRRWTHKSIFETLYDRTFSLFYKWGSGTYYAGTHKAIKLVDLCPNGFEGGIIFSKNVVRIILIFSQ